MTDLKWVRHDKEYILACIICGKPCLTDIQFNPEEAISIHKPCIRALIKKLNDLLSKQT